MTSDVFYPQPPKPARLLKGWHITVSVIAGFVLGVATILGVSVVSVLNEGEVDTKTAAHPSELPDSFSDDVIDGAAVNWLEDKQIIIDVGTYRRVSTLVCGALDGESDGVSVTEAVRQGIDGLSHEQARDVAHASVLYKCPRSMMKFSGVLEADQ